MAKALMKAQLWSIVDINFEAPFDLGSLTPEHQLPITEHHSSVERHCFWKDDELVFEIQVIITLWLMKYYFSEVHQTTCHVFGTCPTQVSL